MKLVEYKLETEPTLSYVVNNLKNLTTLSPEMARFIQSKKGRFFTLLPKGRDLKKLHQFEYGGILKQEKPQTYSIRGRKSIFIPFPDIDKEIFEVVLKKMHKNKSLSCLFEDSLKTTKSPLLDFFIKEKLFFFYKKEVYHLLENSKASLKMLIKLHGEIHATWHSLSFLTSVSWVDKKERSLTVKDIREACSKAELVIIGAYDREAYIFWEKQ